MQSQKPGGASCAEDTHLAVSTVIRQKTIEKRATRELYLMHPPREYGSSLAISIGSGVVSVIAILRQLGRRTLRIDPFQQKGDAGADENERPDPMRVDVDHAHSREQEHETTDQK